MGFINKILELFLGNKYERDMKEVTPLLDKTNEVYETLHAISNDELRARTVQLKTSINDARAEVVKEINALKEEADQVADDSMKEELYSKIDELTKKELELIEEKLLEILPEAFAIVRETARRFKENDIVYVTANDFDRELAAVKESVEIIGSQAAYHNSWIAGGNKIKWDMVHYDVQIIGGIVLHKGKISEMSTGEGKTLVATLPVFLNALAGKGVHIVTVNDYLAKRDSEWMGTMYEFHGLRVDCIDRHQPNSDERRNAYLADITFGTNNEFGFDYLRDNMAISSRDLVQRGHHYSIVDEVDSVLIDDARTPLIISGPIPRDTENQKFEELRPKVEVLFEAQKQLCSRLLADARKLIAENKTEEGGKLLLRAYKGLPKSKPLIKFLSEQGNKALLQKTENFYMQENNKNMPLITSELFFVIEEKLNSIEMSDKGIDMITSKSDDPEFFVLPDIASQLSELEKNNLPAAEKLAHKDRVIQDYSVKSERIHTINQLLKAYAMFEKDVEYVVIDNKVKIVDEQTGRIMEGRRYSDGLHQAIEAKERVKVEAATQTMATVTLQNYFRMYHKLAGMTGTAETEAGEFWNIYKLDVVVIPTNRNTQRKDFEDMIYKTKREKYNAVIDEVSELLKNGRPVLVGTTSVEVSELLSRMLKLRNIKHNVLNAKQHQREAEIVAEAGHAGTVTIATNMAGRGTDIKLTAEVKAAGGLAIIGTERHESRRVDRQLRGRAGRQGDPGSSQFFVSLEDDLMRLFGSDRIASLMDRLGLKDGEMIQHSMITKSIERAQKKVEENNFGIRKRLLEYDDVMNSQREVVYKRRRHALYGERISVDISNMMYDVVESIVNENHGFTDFETFNIELIRHLSFESSLTDHDYHKKNSAEVVDIVFDDLQETYKRKTEAIANQAYPVIKEVFENQSHLYENIVVPVTDGYRTYQVVTNLKKANENHGLELVRSFQQVALLVSIDELWKEHLREMDDLRHSVQNATYEQKDPLLIYKLESFELFKNMLDSINKEVGSVLMKGTIPIRDSSGVKEAKAPKRLNLNEFKTTKDELNTSVRRPQGPPPAPHQQVTQPIRVEKKIGRNDACPCGSGKKYKQCHGKDEIA